MVVRFADVDCEEPAATEMKASDSNEINHNKTIIRNRNNQISGRQSSAAWQQWMGELVLLVVYILMIKYQSKKMRKL